LHFLGVLSEDNGLLMDSRILVCRWRHKLKMAIDLLIEITWLMQLGIIKIGLKSELGLE
jgi:hypothetical protein